MPVQPAARRVTAGVVAHVFFARVSPLALPVEAKSAQLPEESRDGRCQQRLLIKSICAALARATNPSAVTIAMTSMLGAQEASRAGPVKRFSTPMMARDLCSRPVTTARDRGALCASRHQTRRAAQAGGAREDGARAREARNAVTPKGPTLHDARPPARDGYAEQGALPGQVWRTGA